MFLLLLSYYKCRVYINRLLHKFSMKVSCFEEFQLKLINADALRPYLVLLQTCSSIIFETPYFVKLKVNKNVKNNFLPFL